MRVIVCWIALAWAVPPVPLIIDTDMGGGGCMDVDDVGALCMTHALVNSGEVELLAVVQDTSPAPVAGAISAVNHYFGRDDIPIGAYKGRDLDPGAPLLPYVLYLVANFTGPITDSSQVPDSVEVYRRALSSQADHSVVISSIGLLTNLAALLQSEADEVSPLSGQELFKAKVRLLAVMGGSFPDSGGEPKGCNLCGCVFENASAARPACAASGYVSAHLPSEVNVVFSGGDVGEFVRTGGRLATCASSDNPCRRAYLDYLANPPNSPPSSTRPSWDPLTTLAAVRGAEAVGCSECTECDGVAWVDPLTGADKWIRGPASNQTYLELQNATMAAEAIDDLLCQPLVTLV